MICQHFCFVVILFGHRFCPTWQTVRQLFHAVPNLEVDLAQAVCFRQFSLAILFEMAPAMKVTKAKKVNTKGQKAMTKGNLMGELANAHLDQQGQHSCWLYYIENSCFLHPEQLSQLGPSLELTTVDAYQLTLYDIAIAGLALQPTICCLKLKQSITDALCRKVVSSTSGLATLPKKFLLQS